MTHIPPHSAREVIRKMCRAGFVLKRHAKGSHDIYYNPNTGKIFTIPNHPGVDVPLGTLHAIIRVSGLTIEEFLEL